MPIKTKTFDFVSSGNGYKSIAVLNWGAKTTHIKTNYVFVKYVYAFMQDQFEADAIPNSLMQQMEDFCISKGLILYSY